MDKFSHTTWGLDFVISLLVAVYPSEAQNMRKNREKLGKSQAQKIKRRWLFQ
jgi:hypothetical protein